MRNREVINFLLYPKYFSSLAIPYKGKYLIRIRLYQKKTLNEKITYAYPTMKMFKDSKAVKPSAPAKVVVNQNNTFYDTQTFFLFYADQKIVLNTYCIFKLEYDQLRQFKTYIEYELVRKCDSQSSDGSYIKNKKEANQKQQELICKQIYLVNNPREIDSFQRVYFQHHQFYCALDLYICTMSQGLTYRQHKYQQVQYSQNNYEINSLNIRNSNEVKKQKKISFQNNQIIHEAINLVDTLNQVHQQLRAYKQLKKIIIKYQQLKTKTKGSFIYQSVQAIHLEEFLDLDYLQYWYQDYQKYVDEDIAIEELLEDKFLINQNIKYVFGKLPQTIKELAYSSFRNRIDESLKKKYDLKKKYLIKKVANNSFNHSRSFLETSISKINNPRKSFQKDVDINDTECVRNSYTFKQNRKVEKQQFVHIRREQFLKACQIINIKECNFPMMLVQKSASTLFSQDKKFTIKQIAKLKQSQSQKSSDCLTQNTEECSLIVLIHGYQGSHHDLKKLKNYLEHLNPHLKILTICSIQKNINENINFLGQKIASQIEFYITSCCEVFNKISFIGFSLGGVLARACLKYLSKYEKIFNILITLASPHLGVSQSQNALVNFGVWYISKFDKCQNIKQLNFQSVTEKDSFLMKLSLGDQIKWFKKVVIVSSSQDQFVPHYSARIIGSTKNIQINRMAENIISRINNYERIQVWFDVEKKSTLDKLIGRKSHIQFIQNYSFLEMLCKMYENDL